MPFKTLRLIQPLLNAVQSEGYTIPTAIQKEAIPHVLEGRDLLGCAQTGTGKTAAFALPILQRLHGHATSPKSSGHAGAAGHSRPIRALILTPTRELAAQIGESFRVYGQHTGLRHTVIFGGVKQGPQTLALHRGVDILVATPGRLLDLLNQRLLSLRDVEIFVLDEADRMLDMGFIHDIRRVIAQVPACRQTLMFSATMPREILALANTILQKPVHVKIAAESPAADTVKQALYFVDHQSKPALLEHLLEDPQITRALVFTRTKHGADKVARRLGRAAIVSEAIHSNKSQNARMRALANFRGGKTRVLVASDVAARGLDVDDISHVVNYDLPNVAETYVHRIGRTGRAGACGQAISFCCEEQRDDLHEIERLLGRAIPVLHHSIKANVPAMADGGPRPRHVSARTDPVAHAAHKSATPQQQKDEFWRSRRKHGARGRAKPRFKRRGS
ncbi:MAG: DEAD/DEAH box helicase [Phycisphaerae bacterium]|nr:DEAD/DEAH box helicase [Phycisphaerae bacterium]